MTERRSAGGARAAAAIDVHHAWLQKHPTPRAAGGEFHWYAEGAAREDDAAALRGRVVEQVQGLTAPAVWWELSPERVIWAAVFSAISPTDARPYRGVALTVARGPGGLHELLAELPLAQPSPWTEASASAAPAMGSPPSSEAVELARALLSGGAATVEDPHDAGWPARLAALVSLLPSPLGQRTWSGQLTDATTMMLAGRGAGRDGVAELLAAAWRAPGEPASRARAAWQLLVELAANQANQAGRPSTSFDERWLDETLTRSERAAARARDPEALGQWLDEGERAGWARHAAAPPASWPRLLHGWGRGWLDEPEERGARDRPDERGALGQRDGRDSSIAAQAQRFADELALRAVDLLRGGADASSILAEVRWHALLPAAHRRAVLHALARCAPSLMPSRATSEQTSRATSEAASKAMNVASATTSAVASTVSPREPASASTNSVPSSHRSRQESADVA